MNPGTCEDTGRRQKGEGGVPRVKLPRPRTSKGKYVDKWMDTEGKGGGQRSPFRNLALLVFKLCKYVPGVQNVEGERGGSGAF